MSLEPFASASTPMEINPQVLLPIVIGAHPNAELEHRPLGYRLSQVVAERAAAIFEDSNAIVPLVCSDLWYLNDRALLERPTIAIGDPSMNAATAFFSNRVPTAFVVDGIMRLHVDPELIDLHACLWGIDRDSTASAVETFIERYLDEFMAEAGAD
jgi:hypothetical protein